MRLTYVNTSFTQSQHFFKTFFTRVLQAVLLSYIIILISLRQAIFLEMPIHFFYFLYMPLCVTLYTTENMKEHHMTIKKLAQLFFGFFIIALGTVLNLQSNLGMNPWGAFHQGIALNTPLSFGQVSQLTGLLIIALSLFIKIRPGIGTVLNMITIGIFVDWIQKINLIPIPESLIVKLTYLLIGLFIFNYGVYLYLSTELGAGPRDGLLVGLVRITGKTVTTIRPMIEITVLTIGVLLGATFGIGTIVNALLGGWVLQRIFSFHNYTPKSKMKTVSDSPNQ